MLFVTEKMSNVKMKVLKLSQILVLTIYGKEIQIIACIKYYVVSQNKILFRILAFEFE